MQLDLDRWKHNQITRKSGDIACSSISQDKIALYI